MEIRYKLYPYPVLAYYSDDYKDGSFEATIDLRKDGYNIRIDFMASLTNEGLKRLIQTGQARYAYHFGMCTDRFSRSGNYRQGIRKLCAF